MFRRYLVHLEKRELPSFTQMVLYVYKVVFKFARVCLKALDYQSRYYQSRQYHITKVIPPPLISHTGEKDFYKELYLVWLSLIFLTAVSSKKYLLKKGFCNNIVSALVSSLISWRQIIFLEICISNKNTGSFWMIFSLLPQDWFYK